MSRRGAGRGLIGASLATALFVFALAGAAHAYEPIGTEQRISTTFDAGGASRDAFEPAIAYNSAANEFLVVWSSDHSNDEESEIYGQRVGPTGAELGGDFVISETGPVVGNPARDASSPDVAYEPTSNTYLVVWEGDDDATDDDEFEIHGQMVFANGTLNGINFPVSDQGPPDDATIEALEPAVTFNPAQNVFLVVWRGGAANGTGDFEIYGQQLNAAGGQVGADDFQISDAGTLQPVGDRQPEDPDVAYGSGPNEYLVTWHGDELITDNEYEIFGQRLDTSSGQIGVNDFRISQLATDTDFSRAALHPAVAYGSGPNEYLVTWWGDGLAVDGEVEVFGQRIEADGDPVGANDFQISTTGAPGTALPEAIRPAVAYSPTGNEYLVAWFGDGFTANDEYETAAQRLSATGGEIGTDFRVSTTGADNDNRTAEDATLAFGTGPNAYLSAWEADDVANNDELEIFGRLIGKPAAATQPPGGGGNNPGAVCKKPKKKKKKKKSAAAAKKKKKKKKGCKKKKKKRKKK